jgi:hypothetical protein
VRGIVQGNGGGRALVLGPGLLANKPPNPNHLPQKQFNLRIPAMLVRLLLEKLHNAPISLWTLEQLMEADLLKDEGFPSNIPT